MSVWRVPLGSSVRITRHSYRAPLTSLIGRCLHACIRRRDDKTSGPLPGTSATAFHASMQVLQHLERLMDHLVPSRIHSRRFSAFNSATSLMRPRF